MVARSWIWARLRLSAQPSRQSRFLVQLLGGHLQDGVFQFLARHRRLSLRSPVRSGAALNWRSFWGHIQVSRVQQCCREFYVREPQVRHGVSRQKTFPFGDDFVLDACGSPYLPGEAMQTRAKSFEARRDGRRWIRVVARCRRLETPSDPGAIALAGMGGRR
jgi:hypothetical protein